MISVFEYGRCRLETRDSSHRRPIQGERLSPPRSTEYLLQFVTRQLDMGDRSVQGYLILLVLVAVLGAGAAGGERVQPAWAGGLFE